MNISLSSLRTAIQEVENAAKSGTQHHLGQHTAQPPATDSSDLFAERPEKAIRFGMPVAAAQAKPVDQKDATDQPDSLNKLMEDIMKAVMQWLQSILHKGDESGDDGTAKPVAPAPQTALASQAGAGGGAAPAAAPAASSGSSPASGVSANTTLGGGDGLHLPPQLEPYRADIEDAAKATGMPAKVIAAQIWAESRGNLGADTTNVNGKTDAGLMQVNADTFAGLKKENPGLLGNADVNNPHDNIMAGALYLRDQSKAFGGDIGAGLRAYNSGPDKVNRNNLADTGGVGDPNYTANVLKFAEIIGSGKGQLPA